MILETRYCKNVYIATSFLCTALPRLCNLVSSTETVPFKSLPALYAGNMAFNYSSL